jgi:hypothetical protein
MTTEEAPVIDYCSTNYLLELFPEEPKDEVKRLTPAQFIHEITKDRTLLMSKILSMYKLIFTPAQKATWEKTEQEIKEDQRNSTNLSDELAKKPVFIPYAATMKMKYEEFAMFVNYIFLYFMSLYSKDAPFYKLPTTEFKLRIILSCLRINDEHGAFVKALLINIVQDKILLDLCEDPPYYMRCTYAHTTVEEKFMQIKEDFKYGIECLLKIPEVEGESLTNELDQEIKETLNA